MKQNAPMAFAKAARYAGVHERVLFNAALSWELLWVDWDGNRVTTREWVDNWMAAQRAR